MPEGETLAILQKAKRKHTRPIAKVERSLNVLIKADLNEIHATNAVLKQIKHGTYGECIAWTIFSKRSPKAVPYAVKCRKCAA